MLSSALIGGHDLIAAGSPWNALDYPTGDIRIDEVLKPRMLQRIDGAALLGDEATLVRLLGESAGPDELTEALAGAAKGGHAALCRRLLKAGAPVNGSTGYDRVTPLMCAVSSRSYETVEVLLEHGADVAAKNVNGSTALHVGIARDVSLETIRPLLRSGANAQIETNEFGYTPLRVAHERGREEIVQLLRESQKAKSE